MPHIDREKLAADLAGLLAKLSDESAFYLRQALDAADLEKVGGTLLINVPKRTGEFAQVRWAGGSHESFMRL